MKLPRGQGGSVADTASLGAPTSVVIIVLVFGATVYLWRARYIRPSTAYVVMAACVLSIAAVAYWTYSHPM